MTDQTATQATDPQTMREQYADAIRDTMLRGLQDAELYDESGRERILEWVEWIAKTVDGVRDRELAQARAEVIAARTFAGEMRDFCSPHGVAVDYADRLIEAMDRAKGEQA